MIKILAKILGSNPAVIIIIIVVLVVIFIIRKTRKGLINNASEKIYNRLRKHPEQIAAFCDEVDLTYFTKSYDRFNLQDFRARIDKRKFGKFIIMDCLETDQRLLLYTKCTDTESGITWNGEPGEVKNDQYYFFVVADQPLEKKVHIFGEYYEGNNDKYIKNQFAKLLAEDL